MNNAVNNVIKNATDTVVGSVAGGLVSNGATRTRNIYNSLSDKPFKISRSKLDLFLECPCCFYIDRKLGVKRPDTPPYSLNIAVDELLKKEFDACRKTQTPHPIFLDHNLGFIPFEHPDIDKWRDSLHHGVQYVVPNTNLMITGGIDDVCVNPKTQELIVVDYKATSKKGPITLDEDWQIAYKRQIEVYQWLFRKNGFKVSKTAYFVYCNGKKSAASFDKCLNFEVSLIAYDGDDSWVEPTVMKLYQCLQSDVIPMHDSECEYGQYFCAVDGVMKK